VSGYQVAAVTGVGEVVEGADLAGLLLEHAELRDGDVVVVTSKVVSKAEGRTMRGDREAALGGETDRVVARRGPTTIVRTHHGLVMAAAGIDASNTAPGTVVLLPRDPDGSARRLRDDLLRLGGVNVGVVVSDTSGRAWRHGQTDIAIGAAGLVVLDDHAGRTDPYGNPLVVTAPALADGLAGAADLATGKTSGCPAAVVHGLGTVVLPSGDHGDGASALVREEEADLFGYGAREGVLRALDPTPSAARGFGATASADELVGALVEVLGPTTAVRQEPDAVTVVPPPLDARVLGRLEARAEAVARAHRWAPATTPTTAGEDAVLRFVPVLS
jgi:coenzyme F420-0:L-glutamate ligase/coenzyme F420-1:gamma-L-glutamate ligase